MRPCIEYEALISAFIDGELSEADRGELMEHMASCPHCQAYFDDQIAIHDSLHPMEETAVPVDLTAKVMEQIRAERKPEKKVIPFPQWKRFAALAACCAVVILGVWTMGGSDALAPAAQTDSAAPNARLVMDDAAEPEVYAADADSDAIPEEAAMEPELTALPDAADYAGGSAVTAKGPAARAWVEEELKLPWLPGERYELTAEQYRDLLSALDEAQEVYATPAPGEVEGYWVIMEE